MSSPLCRYLFGDGGQKLSEELSTEQLRGLASIQAGYNHISGPAQCDIHIYVIRPMQKELLGTARPKLASTSRSNGSHVKHHRRIWQNVNLQAKPSLLTDNLVGLSQTKRRRGANL